MTVINEFLALVNLANVEKEANLKVGDVVFTSVTAGEFGAKNTEVVMTGVDDRGYIGPVTVHHDRLDVARIVPADAAVALLRDSSETIHDVLTHLAVERGVTLELTEFTDTPIDVFAVAKVDLTPLTESLKYIGVAPVTVTVKDSTMSEVVTATDLPGWPKVTPIYDMLIYSQCRAVPYVMGTNADVDGYINSAGIPGENTIQKVWNILLPRTGGWTSNYLYPWNVAQVRRVYRGVYDPELLPEECKGLAIELPDGYTHVVIEHQTIKEKGNTRGYVVFFYRPAA